MNHSPRLTLITLLLAVSNLPAATRYVWQGRSSPGPPYTNWITAGTNIQNAVDAASAGDEIVVTNGIYASGSRATSGDLRPNRLSVTKSVIVRSVNGQQFT